MTTLIIVGCFAKEIKALVVRILTAKFGPVVIGFGDAKSDLSNIEPGAVATIEGSPKPTSTTAHWDRVGNVFWLGGDLIATAQTALRGAPKDSIFSSLRQSHHHISELGLAESRPAEQISLLKSEVENLPETSLNAAWRTAFSGKIYAITGMLDGILRKQQPGYRPRPQS